MMVKRRPVRQLSLQQSGTQRRPTLRKQQSEDGAGLRVTASSIRSSASTPVQAPAPAHSGFRPPRPVKLAWADRRPPEHAAPQPPGVEVIARRLPGQPRPSPNTSTSNKPRNNLPSIDKDSILYTRQQLAERLRRAWKEREQSRPNLDIFLAHHHSVEAAQEDTSIIHEPTPRDCPTPFSTSPSTLRLTISSPSLEVHSEQDHPKKSTDGASLCSTPSTARVEDSAEPQYSYSSPTVHNFAPFPKSSTANPEAHSQPVNSSSIGERLTISIRNGDSNATITDAPQNILGKQQDDEEEKTALEASTRKKENTCPNKDSTLELNITGVAKEVSEEKQNESKTSTAAAKRVSFRNSRSTTISNSFCIDEPPPTPPPVPSTPMPPPRAMSAPSNRGILLNREVKKEVAGSPSEAAANSLARNIRSAPANKRRLKPSVSVVTGKGIRAKPGVRGAGEESSGGEEGGGDKKRPAGRRGVPRGAEIVTMVSLLSDDDEDGSNNGGDADRQAAPGFLQFPQQQQQQSQPTATAPVSLMEADTRLPATPPPVLVPPRVVCLRKTAKTVTFQQPPATTWKVASSGTSTPAAPRRVTPIIVPASRRSSVSTLRPSSAPAAATKERTPETQAPKEVQTEKKQLELDSSTEVTQVPDATQQKSPLPPPTPSDSVVLENSSPGVGVMVARILKPAGQGQEFCVRQEQQQQQEPQFQTPKERECWQLYRKMLEKGVTVSYDTVLRGMLTPTEYRLRRGALLSSC